VLQFRSQRSPVSIRHISYGWPVDPRDTQLSIVPQYVKTL